MSSRLVFPKGRTWAAQGAPLSRRRWPTLRAGSVCWGWDRQRSLSTAPRQPSAQNIYFCAARPWRRPEAAAQYGGWLVLLHALPGAGTRHKDSQRQGMLTRVWQKQGRLLTRETKRNKTTRCLLVCPLPTM